MRLRRVLTYSGTLPFASCAALLLLQVPQLPLLGDVRHILCQYALIIAVFMAGVHWGQQLQLQGARAQSLALISNIITVILFILSISVTTIPLLIAFLISFVILLFIDKQLFVAQIIDADYFNLRLHATTIVCLSLLLALFALSDII